MNALAWIAIIAIVVTVLIAIGGALFAHVRNDEQRHTDVAGRLKSVENEIGTHDSGIRGELHRQVNLIGKLRAVVYFLAKRFKLEVMNDLDDDK